MKYLLILVMAITALSANNCKKEIIKYKTLAEAKKSKKTLVKQLKKAKMVCVNRTTVFAINTIIEEM